MKKRILSILLCLCMVLMLCPATAFAEEPPTLTVTVDNFEAGKILGDCMFSFETTNLDVPFDETDILGVTWEAYDPYLEAFTWMDDRNMFEAGTRYQCTIELDSKGLTTAPAVTVNGKTPESCEIGTSDGKAVLRISCELGTPPAPSITIDGPFEICAQQDYEFSATAAEGVEVLYFAYRFGVTGTEPGWSRGESGVYYGAVPASDYGSADSFELTVYGKVANGRPVTATKTVQIWQDHLYDYMNGICGCGAVRQSTITYDGGEDAEGSIPSGIKTYGVDFTLSSDTFTREGYIQTGWQAEYGEVFELGGVYKYDTDMTFYPVWEELITVTASFTTTVALGDADEPGETTFELGLIDSEGYELTFDGMYFDAEITTDGAGSYSGEVTITATGEWLYDMLYEGAFIWQYDDEEEGWTYDDTVWGVRLYMPEIAARSMDAVQYSLLLYPAYLTDDGYFNLDLNAGPVEEMTFINTYTAHAYELKHDETSHWDECECGDVQNKELHKYGDWKVTKEATETAVGEKEHTCTVCGYTEKAEIAKLPAKSDTDTKPATDTKPGTETKPATSTVQTGDNGNLTLWLAMLVASAAGMIGTGVYIKRRRNVRGK